MNEGPGRFAHLANPRFRPRAADRKSSPVDRRCGRASKTGHRFGSGRRRHPTRNNGRDPTTIRLAKAPVPLGGNRRMWTKDETVRLLPAERAQEPRHDRELDANMPRRTATKEDCPFFGRQIGNSHQIHLNGSGERGLGLVEGKALNRDVEIDAERLPICSTAIGVASKLSIHANSPRHDLTRKLSGALLYQYVLPSLLWAGKSQNHLARSSRGTPQCRMG